MTPKVNEKLQRSGTKSLHDDEGDIVDLTGSPPLFKRLKRGHGEDDGISFSDSGTRETSLNVAHSAYFPKRLGGGPPTPLLEQISINRDGMNMLPDDHDHDMPEPSGQTESSNGPAKVIQSNLLDSYRFARAASPKVSHSGFTFGYYAADASDGFTALQSDTHPEDSLPIVSQVRTMEQEERHQEWQRRINAPGGIVPRRRSLALDEAATAEARRQAREDDADADAEEIETAHIDDVARAEEEEHQKIAERVGNKLKEKYAAKGIEVANGKARGQRKKKGEEVGPSGQTYTPLEKQFMEIKAENPDVLLMMEGLLPFSWYCWS